MTNSTSGPPRSGASGAAAGQATGHGPTSRYIVRATADAGALRRFIDGIGADPVIRLVDTIGPSAGPHTVVIETDAHTAEQLRQRHQNQLTIEPDQPLSLFD